MHSKNVTDDTPFQVEDKIKIAFNNFSLSEEVRVNLIFKGFKISKPEYNDNYTHFSRTYERIISK